MRTYPVKPKRALLNAVVLTLSFILLTACAGNEPPVGKELPRSTPEAEGVSSQSILNFLDAVEETGQELHSFMYLRHGKVIAEGWWDPYGPDLKHTLYSTSKSFTSTAIGFAVSEGLLSVDDKVISFFPESLPDTVSDNLAAMTVQHLLTMGAGQEPPLDLRTIGDVQNWVEAFLSYPVVHEPGTEFEYNSVATYMLSAIITKVTGESMLDYLKPRLFDPLQIEGMDWEVDPEGIVNSGGWGLRLKTEDMAKFGQLYLQKGKWNGEQLLPEAWIEEASAKHIDQAPGLSEKERVGNDWVQGYGYKFWRSQHGAYRADGAFGQLIIIFPAQEVVVAVTAELGNMQNEMNLVWNHLLPGMSEKALQPETEKYGELMQRLDRLSLPAPDPSSNDSLLETIAGNLYEFSTIKDSDIASCIFGFEPGRCYATFTLKDGTKHLLALGAGEWVTGETLIPGPNLVPFYPANAGVLLPATIEGAYAWKGGNTLELTTRYIESPHTTYYTFTFDGDRVVLETSASRGLYKDKPPQEGKVSSSQ
jgi:CubicO group peptidase (beta-lactamase class C family)